MSARTDRSFESSRARASICSALGADLWVGRNVSLGVDFEHRVNFIDRVAGQGLAGMLRLTIHH